MAALTPTADQGLIDGSQSGSDNYQYEIGANKSPSCLIEVEYHDGPNVAQWILDNEDNIAAALAKERRKHRAAHDGQHRHAQTAAVGIFAVGHGITSKNIDGFMGH